MINRILKHKKAQLLYVILVIFMGQLGWTQIYPVQVNSNVIPPYLSSVSKYSTTTDQKYLVNIFTSDLSVVNRQVKLKLYIQGNGINAQSAPVVVGADPLFINGGESLQLNNLDLYPYFQLQNLQGITPQQYSGVLPQGNYNFCIEVYDFVTNQVISQKSCTFFYFIYNDPPLLNLPFNHDVIHFQDPQNIIFTWSPRHINATNIEYEFTLIEILDNQAPSNYAFVVGAPIWQETLNNTILNYSFNLPQLIAGRKYVWRVKAVSQPGFGEDAVFNNNGYSEIYDFIYAGNCNAPEFVMAQSTSARQAKIMWQSNSNHLGYVVQYRKLGTQEWFNAPVANGEALLYDLEPSATYEFQVGGTCLGDITTFSAITQFTQLDQNVAVINCGIAPAINLSNVNLYDQELAEDMVFMASDFAVHINEVQGVGTYTGKGWTRLPYLSNIKVAVEFTNIKLNSDLKLVDGEVKAQYDPTWGNIVSVNDIIDVVEDALDYAQEANDSHYHLVDFVIGDVSNIIVENGQILITNPETGLVSAIFDFDQGENTTIQDSSGTYYNVDPNGNVSLQGQGIGIPNSSNTENLNSNGEVTALSNVGAKVVFSRSTQSVAFDDTSAAYTGAPAKLAQEYKTIKDGTGSDYPFYYKAVINKDDGVVTYDYVTAQITITDTLIKAKDIVFNSNGIKVNAVDSTTVGNVITKTLKIPAFTIVAEDQLLALVKTDSLKQKVVGAMKVIPIKDVGTLNVSLIPVNGAVVTQEDIQEVKNIYGGAGVTLNITTLPAYTDGITTLECGTSGFIANYTSEQRDFIDHYKATKTIANDQYYLFVTKDIQPSRPLSGFMPLHRQFGFVFTGQSGSEVKATNGSGIATIIAHELGHGAFELEHPWEKYDYDKNTYATNWLMDYASGTKLPYRHWQQISRPKTSLYLFQSDESGEQVTVSNMELLTKFKNQDGTFTFLSMSGKPITLPSNTTSVTFSTGDDLNLVECQDDFKIEPFGSLRGFIINDVSYSFCGVCNSSIFSGYFEVSSNCQNKYIDTLSNQNNRNAIIGLPCISDGAVVFKVMLLNNYFQSFDFTTITTNYNASGDLKAYDYFIDNLNQVNDEDIVYVLANFNPKFDEDVIKFLSDEYCFCSENDFSSIAYAFIYATQLQKNKEYLGCFKSGLPLFFYDENIDSDKLQHVIVKHWKDNNINGFKTLKNHINKFKSLNISFENNIGLYNFLKNYVPEEISDSNANTYTLRFGTTYWESGLVLDKVQNITSSQLLRQHDDIFCLWESIPILDRLDAIDYISSTDVNNPTDRHEEILLYLIITTPDYEKNLLFDELKLNDYYLLWRVWRVLDKDQRAIFISYLTRYIVNDDMKNAESIVYNNFKTNCLNSISNTPCNLNNYKILPLFRANAFDVVDFEFNLGTGGATYELDYFLETSITSNNKINITASINSIDFSRVEDYFDYFLADNEIFNLDIEPFKPVILLANEDIKLNGQILLQKGSIAAVPAIFVHWLDSSIDTEQNQVVLRAVGDGLVVASIIASGGATTPLLALDVAIFGTDLGITIINETSENIDPKFLETWNAVYSLYAIATLPRAVVSSAELLSLGTTKLFTFVESATTANRFSKILINKQFLSSFIGQYRLLSNVEKLATISSIDKLILSLKNLKGVDAIITRNLYRSLLEIRIQLLTVSSNTPLLTVESSIVAFQPYLKVSSSNGGSFSSLGQIEMLLQGGNEIPVLVNQIRWLPQSIDVAIVSEVAILKSIGYKENGVIKLSDLKIVQNNGQFYVLPVSNSVSFINTLQTNHPILYQKFLSLSNNLKPNFVTDFELADATTLNKLATNNGELVDVWSSVKYRFESRKKIEFLEALIPSRIVTNKHVPGELNIESKSYGYKIQVKGYHMEVDEVILNPPLHGTAGIPNPANSNAPIIVTIGTPANPATKGRYRISDVRDFVNNDMPYTAKIDVEIPNNSGNFFPKSGVDGKNRDATGAFISGRSSVFPKSWNLDRIAEETAFVRSKIDSSVSVNADNSFSAMNSENTFEIKMYINGDRNNYRTPIASTFPKIN